MSKVLVIGSTGLLGSAALRYLSPSFPLIALRHRTSPCDVAVDTRDADLLQPGTILRCLDGVRTILFFPSFSTPLHAPLDPRHEIATTVPALTNLLAAASEAGTRPHLLFASTAGAMYGETDETCGEDATPAPINSYGLGKLLSENIIEFYSRLGAITHTVIRFSNLYGALGRRVVRQGAIDIYLDDALAGEVSTVWADPSSTRDYLHVDDAAAAIGAVLSDPEAARNATFNVSSGTTTSMRDVLALVGSVTEGRHRYAIAGMHAAAPTHTRIDSSRFRAVFPGWPEAMPLDDGIALAWRRKRQHQQGPGVRSPIDSGMIWVDA